MISGDPLPSAEHILNPERDLKSLTGYRSDLHPVTRKGDAQHTALLKRVLSLRVRPRRRHGVGDLGNGAQ